MWKVAFFILLSLVGISIFFNNSEEKSAEDVSNTTVSMSAHVQRDYAWLQFNVDNFNKIITTHGKIGNAQHQKEILSILAQNYPAYSVKHDIIIDENVNSKDLTNNLTYIIAVTVDVQLLDIELTDKQLTIRGLVRNKIIENTINNKLDKLFKDELVIHNQIEQVAEFKIEIKNIKFEPPKIPIPVQQ